MNLRRAFTLVELLVVIALIAILASIANWAIGSMLDKGADSRDLNNLRQIGTAISTFAAENNGRVPNQYVKVPGDSRSSFMACVEHTINPKATGIYTWTTNSLWYSKRFAKMPDGQSIPAGVYYWGLAWGMNGFLFYDTSRSFEGYLNRAPNLSKLVLVGEKIEMEDTNLILQKNLPFSKMFYLTTGYQETIKHIIYLVTFISSLSKEINPQ